MTQSLEVLSAHAGLRGRHDDARQAALDAGSTLELNRRSTSRVRCSAATQRDAVPL